MTINEFLFLFFKIFYFLSLSMENDDNKVLISGRSRTGKTTKAQKLLRKFIEEEEDVQECISYTVVLVDHPSTYDEWKKFGIKEDFIHHFTKSYPVNEVINFIIQNKNVRFHLIIDLNDLEPFCDSEKTLKFLEELIEIPSVVVILCFLKEVDFSDIDAEVNEAMWKKLSDLSFNKFIDCDLWCLQ